MNEMYPILRLYIIRLFRLLYLNIKIMSYQLSLMNKVRDTENI